MLDGYVEDWTDKNVITSNSEIKYIKIYQIEPNRDQPRKYFDDATLKELAESIRQFGILQPLVVCKKDGYYELVAGERRWRAARLAGLKEIPVVIKNLTYQEITEISIIENIQRENLNPIEEAQAYKRLLEEFGLSHGEVANRVFKSRSVVANALRLLKLCDPIQEMLITKVITMGQARPLIAIEDSKAQYQLAKKIVDEKLSARAAEDLVKKTLKERFKSKPRYKDEDLAIFYEEFQRQMQEHLGTKVSIRPMGDKKGKIEIEYYSMEDLEDIFDRMR